MCNPRTILMRATEQLAQAWQAELERTARVSGSATGEARLVQQVGTLLAPAALRAFERAVGADEHWSWRDDAYYLDIPGGHASYRPASQELELVVELTEDLVGTGVGSAVLSGEVVGQATAEGVSRAYPWYTAGRGVTEARRDAQAQASSEARRRAETQALHLAESARADALADSSGLRATAENEAQLAAFQDLERQRAERSAELSADAREGLTRLREETMRGVFNTVAAGMQQALLEYAQEHGATDLVIEDSEGFVDIQFEMEA